jgi:type I restriction enzyme S subunit
MNPELLLAHFDRICSVPDAIPRLRLFILDLAVRGKLVEQDRNEEPASELLKRIQIEKARLQKGSEIGHQKPLPQIQGNDLPFVAPPGWSWARLAAISRRIHYGYTASANPSLKDVRLLRITDIQNNVVDWLSVPGCEISEREVEQYRLQQGDILIARTGGTIGKTFLVSQIPVTAIFASYLIRIQKAAELYDRYLKLFLESPVYWKQLQEGTRGGGQPNVNGQTLGKMNVPVPPLAEQRRIVAKVDELTALCDRLDTAKRDRESRRDRLTAATYQQLTNRADAETQRSHAQFFIGQLPRLTVRPDQLQQLRQTILTLAVRGQLVPQEPTDEPAHKLLIRIHAVKGRLLKEGIIKKLDSMALPAASEFPFALPPGWAASNLQSLCTSITDGDHLPPPKSDLGIPFLVIGNVRGQTLDFAGCRHVTEEYYSSLDSIRRPRQGDILYTLVGSYGIPVIVEDDRPFCVQRHIGILRPVELISVPFLSRVLGSNWVFDQATAYATGIAQKTVPLSGLRKILIPLPPLAEQSRIVAKVDELMTVCDQLGAQLTTGQLEVNRLLGAVLHQALDSSDRTVESKGVLAGT